MSPLEHPRAATLSLGTAAALLFPFIALGEPTTLIPEPAREAGYLVHTFQSDHFGEDNVDVKSTCMPGYQWYFDCPGQPAKVTLNPDGSITVLSTPKERNGGVATIGKSAKTPFFHGTSFGGGGYFEATLKFDSGNVRSAVGFPSWWAIAVEHLCTISGGSCGSGDQWPLAPIRYNHFGELDFFEFNRQDDHSYGGTLHDWYGEFNVTCKSYCNVDSGYGTSTRVVPADTDWSQYHRIGALWVSATPNARGCVTFYFDERPVGQPLCWERFVAQSPPPGTDAGWTFGVLDRDHLVLVFGSGSSPMTVKAVNVWQQNPTQDLVQ
jgi:hypothetical protein